VRVCVSVCVSARVGGYGCLTKIARESVCGVLKRVALKQRLEPSRDMRKANKTV